MAGFTSLEDVKRHSVKCKESEVAEEKWIKGKKKSWDVFKVTNRFTLTVVFKGIQGGISL